MSQPALDVAIVLRGRLVAVSITTRVCRRWTFVRITVATDDVLWSLAEALGLETAGTVSRGRVWWRRATHKRGGVVVVAAGLNLGSADVD